MKAVVSTLALALAFCAPPAPAETWGVATIASYHTNRHIEHNERNYGLGIEHDIAENWRLSAGEYKNSYYRQSWYAGGLWFPLRYGEFRAGAMFGLVTGYDHNIDLVVMPTIAWEGRSVGVNVGIMPAVAGRYVSVIGLQLKVKF